MGRAGRGSPRRAVPSRHGLAVAARRGRARPGPLGLSPRAVQSGPVAGGVGGAVQTRTSSCTTAGRPSASSSRKRGTAPSRWWTSTPCGGTGRAGATSTGAAAPARDTRRSMGGGCSSCTRGCWTTAPSRRLEPGRHPMAGTSFDLIAFDGDDTLWHNERSYREGRERFRRLLAAAGVDLTEEEIEERVNATELREHRVLRLRRLQLRAVADRDRNRPHRRPGEWRRASTTDCTWPSRCSARRWSCSRGRASAVTALARDLPAHVDHQGRPAPPDLEAGTLRPADLLPGTSRWSATRRRECIQRSCRDTASTPGGF